ncbi:MAG: hypothetical protein M5R42_16250 [Rhodocyclaceae bacterium]|nr:hypothetical protein [Rhodocyclaceae bacterium]
MDRQPLVRRPGQKAAEWLVEREWFGPLESNAPWWLLTHYPEANDVFTWLDGA